MSEDIKEGEQDVADDWAAAMAEQAESEPAVEEEDVVNSEAGRALETKEEYQAAEFQDLHAEEFQGSDDVNLDVILEIPVTLSMEIGRTDISIRNLLQLNQGSVVELDRLAGEPMDVMVNGTLVAHGEVVVVNEKFGIRLTDVISPQERVKKLR